MRSKKLLKKGGAVENILLQYKLTFVKDRITITNELLPDESLDPQYNLYDAIFTILSKKDKDSVGGVDVNTLQIRDFLNLLSKKDVVPNSEKQIFSEIAEIVKNFDQEAKDDDKDTFFKNEYNFFPRYQLGTKETSRKYITIDPTIIQIMIFDDKVENYFNGIDIVYSLKLILRGKNKLVLRYTTQLFPNNSKIKSFKNLTDFNNFNLNLGNITHIVPHYLEDLAFFFKKYIKFYNFYKKCYTIEQSCNNTTTLVTKELVDYQLKYISILGKARFWQNDIQKRTSLLTDYVMSNLIFSSPSYAFISGGYKGFATNNYGITRSGYEIAKKYNRPILTIMCAEGLVDSHFYSDATLIYGEHWGEDSIALSQLTDGAIIIAPFGGWTYIECLTLLANKKIVGIYNDFYNILNYVREPLVSTNEDREYEDNIKKEIPTIDNDKIKELIEQKNKNKTQNILFFKFAKTEQNSIIDLYINYYLILMYILLIDTDTDTDTKNKIQNKNEFNDCLHYGIKILMYLKSLLIEEKVRIVEEEKIPQYNPTVSNEFYTLITVFNEIKEVINKTVNIQLGVINEIYLTKCDDGDKYQNVIPEKCDGIWIKPLFSLIDNCIKKPDVIAEDTTAKEVAVKANEETITRVEQLKGGKKMRCKKGGTCNLAEHHKFPELLLEKINKYSVNFAELSKHPFFTKLNNNLIFVFSDVMYLNLYLNTNLNTSYFQQELHKKINDLSITNIGTFKSASKLLEGDNKKYINLNRNLDGMFCTEKSDIINDNIIKEKFSFIINQSCNNYTKVLIDTTLKGTTVNMLGPSDKTKTLQPRSRSQRNIL